MCWNLLPLSIELIITEYEPLHFITCMLVSFFFLLFQTLTNSFQAYDTNRNGWIQIGYEQFLTLVFNLKS